MNVKLALLTVIASSSAMAIDMNVVAHRGHWKEAGLPQNTVESIRRAYEIGFKTVETDFIETESGEIICLHDAKALASMSSIVKDPKKITPADRETINLGEKLKLPRPYRIPLLKDVLAVVPKDCVLQAEIKGYGNTYAKQFDDAVKAAGLTEENIVVSSFNDQALADFHAKYPKYQTLWLGAGVSAKSKTRYDIDKIIARAKQGGFNIVCPGSKGAMDTGFSLADADKIRAAGFDFRLFGVSSQKTLKYAASLGATGFTSDAPLAVYGFARQLGNIHLLPDFGKLIPDDLKGSLSDKVKTIGIVMPASIAKYSDYARCKAWFEYAGYKTKAAPRISFKKRASVADRVADFEEMWMDPEVDLVFCVRGGSGAQDLIGKLDWAKLRTRGDQKVLGFSNITWLLNAMLNEKAGHPISGPSLTQVRYLEKPSLEWLGKVLGNEPLPPQSLNVLHAGACSGLPCGGHLAMLDGLRGRKQLPEAKGRVIFIESSPRKIEQVRKALNNLEQCGWFKEAAGVVFADIQTKPAEELAAIKRDFAAKVSCPVYEGYHYGHVPVSFAIDFRRPVKIDAEGKLVFEL